MQHILVYSDSLSWGIVPGTRRRLAFDERWPGVLELALRHRGDAYRVVYALQIGADVWVLHAFQKKSKSGIKTPKAEVDLIHERLKRLKEMLR